MNYLLLAVFFFSIIEWIGEFRKDVNLIRLSKPLVLIMLLVWCFVQVDFNVLHPGDYGFRIVWFMVGLFFCLVGDIFLMYPQNLFVPGVLSFTIGQIFYIIGFGNLIPPEYNYFPSILIIIMLCFVTITYTSKLRTGLEMSGRKGLIVPVTIYSFIISLMVYSALATLIDRDWHYSAALLVSFGALSFYISDIMYAWNDFVKRIPGAPIKIMIAYYLAQIAIISGVVIHFVFPLDT